MYYNDPVLIPDIPGRIVLKKKGESTYVLFQLSRSYDKEQKKRQVQRCIIGIQIPRKPEMMLPNENYLRYFVTAERGASNEREEDALAFGRKMAQWEKLRDDFDHMYYDFQTVSRGRWNEVVSPDSVTMINEILAPVIEMLKEDEDDWAGMSATRPGEGNGVRLGLIPEPVEHDAGGVKGYEGKTFEYVNYLLGQFKGAIGRFFQNRRLS